jgi:RNA-directed DNA polymerase
MSKVKTEYTEWHEINWRKLEKSCHKLQKRIFQAKKEGNVTLVRQLQKLLTKSFAAKAIAVRKTTQENRGKKTAGVDGVKAIPPSKRLEMVKNLKISHKTKPLRRIYIPKPGTEEKRPLSIPTIYDRAVQMLIKMALEPEWESIFEPNSYGFRPGRSCHDAIDQIYLSINKKPKWVLDGDISKCFDKINHKYLLDKLRDNLKSFSFIRYADDFVCLHESKEVIEKAQEILEQFLQPIGLELKPEKTQIIHTLHGEKPGFEFLGFDVRQYKVNNTKSGFKTLIKPSKKSIKKHYEKIAETVRNHKTAKQENLIKLLNPIIRGWCNYHSTAVSKETFSKLDNLTYGLLKRWCKRRHPNKSKTWVNKKYYHKVGNRNWVFKEGEQKLIVHADTPIVRHIKVRGDKSPFDGDTVYWATRLGRSVELSKSEAKLLKNQKGKCNHCGRMFKDGDAWEIDHIQPKSLNGKNSYNNLQLLHIYCHDQKTKCDGSLNRGIHDKDQVREERNEGKLSRSVLKTSQRGDSLA